MDYAKIFRRALDILIAHWYLIVMGVLAAFNSPSTFNSSGGSSGSGSDGSGGEEYSLGPLNELFDGTLPSMEAFDWLWVLPGILLFGLMGLAILLGLVLWAIGAIAHGGLIAGVDNAEEKIETTFGQAWGAGWARGWRLIGISILPMLPPLIFFGLALVTITFSVGLFALSAENIGVLFGSSVMMALVCVFCLLAPVWLLLDVFRIFAMRSCMLENTGVVASYQRGWQVVKTNLGPALILLMLRLGFALLLGVILFLPTIMMSICCFLWPLMLLVNGTITAYFSTVWTLAWREWTGRAGSGEPGDEATLAQAS